MSNLQNHIAIGDPDPGYWNENEECCICGLQDWEDNMEQVNGEWYCKNCEIKEP